MFTVTPLYSAMIGVINMILWVRTTKMRASKRISIGDGQDPNMLLRIRQHGNCAEWSSFLLIQMILAESMGVGPGALNAAGALLVFGRVVHPFGLDITTAKPLRYVGNGANIMSAVICIVSIVTHLTIFKSAI